MVNRGRSAACHTCKERRVKCNAARPECGPCKRLNLPCGGYKARPASLKFRDQTHKFFVTQRSEGYPQSSSGDSLSPPVESSSSSEPELSPAAVLPAPVPSFHPFSDPSNAVPFFLGHYASMGRDLGCARGFYEMLVPVYRSEQSDSAFALAVLAVATGIQNLWLDGPRGLLSSQDLYMQAVARVRLALKDDAERGRSATVLAVLTLQKYENLAAMYGLNAPTPIHHNGAVNLLSECVDGGVVAGYVRRFIFHMKVSSALRQKTPVQSDAMDLMRSMESGFAPDNPSAELDIIGASVAELQAVFLQAKSVAKSPASWLEKRTQCLEEAARIDATLQVWARTLPHHWHPTHLQDLHPTIPTYNATAAVYPSCQIASIWNLYRAQRLILVKTALTALNTCIHDETLQPLPWSPDSLINILTEFDAWKARLQELVDEVCYTVPFHLGNRVTPSTMSDFSDPNLLLPSHHSLHNGSNRRRSTARTYISEEEHRQHIIARGHSLIMGPLSNLLTLFSDVEEGEAWLSECLREGQLDWIRAQFVRVALVLRLPGAEEGEAVGGVGFGEQADVIPMLGVKEGVGVLAKRVRGGAVFMSGL